MRLMLLGPPPVEYYLAGVQIEETEMSTIGLITDVSCAQVMSEMSYAIVAFQVFPELELGTDEVDLKMRRKGNGHMEPPLFSVVTVDSVVTVPRVVQAQALWNHSVDGRRGIGVLVVAAKRLRVGKCTIRSVRWLLGSGRRWGKHMSSVVVFRDYCMGSVVMQCGSG